MAVRILREGVDERMLMRELTVTQTLSYLQQRKRIAARVLRLWAFEEGTQETTVSVPLAWARNNLELEGTSEFAAYRERRLRFTGKLWEKQVEPARRAWAALRKNGAAILALGTGYGKTTICMWLMSRLENLPALVVYSFLTLEQQWADGFREFTDARVWVVSRQKRPPPKGFHVILCSVGKLRRIPAEILDNVGILAIDEVHCFYTQPRLQALLSIHPRYVIPMSATPQKENGLDRALSLIAGDVEIRVPGRLFEVVQVPTEVDPVVELDAEGIVIWASLVDALARNRKRNELIVTWLGRLSEQNRKVLVLTARVRHSEILVKRARRYFGFVDGLEGKTASLFQGAMRSYRDADVLVSTYEKSGTGFDEKAFVKGRDGLLKRIDAVAITFPLKDPAFLEQLIGRGFRTDRLPLVVDFCDDHPTTARQAQKRLKFYRAKGARILDAADWE